MKQFYDVLQKFAYDIALNALKKREPGLEICSRFRSSNSYYGSSKVKYSDPEGFHLGEVTTKAHSIYFDSNHETFNVESHLDGFSFAMEEKHYVNSSMKTKITFYAFDEKEEQLTREKIHKFLDKLMEGVTPEEGFFTANDESELLLEDGVEMNAAKTWGIIRDPTAKASQTLISAAGIDKTEPVLTFDEIPMQAIRALKAYVNQEEAEQFSRAILIGNSLYSAASIASVLAYVGNKEVNFYQNKDSPVGIKTKAATAVIAPMIEQEGKINAPTLNKVIAMADEILMKAEERKPTFSLVDYAKSKKKT